MADPIASLSDCFDGSTLDFQKWVPVGPEAAPNGWRSTEGDGSITVADGKLTLQAVSVADAFSGKWVTYIEEDPLDITAFQATIEFGNVDLGPDFTEFEILLLDASDNEVGKLYFYPFAPDVWCFPFFWFQGAADFTVDFAGADKFWRITRTGDTWKVETSPDGANWTTKYERTPFPGTQPTEARFHLGINLYETGTATVEIGGINCASAPDPRPTFAHDQVTSVGARITRTPGELDPIVATRLQVASTQDFSGGIVYDSGAGGEASFVEKVLGGLSSDTQYWYRGADSDGQDFTDWSDVGTFTTLENQRPGAPSLELLATTGVETTVRRTPGVDPEGDAITATRIQFVLVDWSDPNYDPSIGPHNLEYDSGELGEAPFAEKAFPLSPDQTYVYRAQDADAGGFGDWSEWYRVEVPPEPTRPVVTSPAAFYRLTNPGVVQLALDATEATSAQGLPLTYRWRYRAGANGVAVDVVAGLESPAYAWNVSALPARDFYYVGVGADDGTNVTWSEWVPFHIARSAREETIVAFDWNPWANTNDPLDLVGPCNPVVVQNGVRISTDGGLTWSPFRDAGICFGFVFTGARGSHCTESEGILAVVSHVGGLYGDLRTAGIVRWSDDLGETWQEDRRLFPTLVPTSIRALDGRFVVTGESVSPDTFLENVPQPRIGIPLDDDRRLVGTGSPGGAFRLNAFSWPDGGDGAYIAVDMAAGNGVVVIHGWREIQLNEFEHFMARSTDYGQTWSLIDPFGMSEPYSPLNLHFTGGYFYAVLGDPNGALPGPPRDLWRSTNGSSWTKVSTLKPGYGLGMEYDNGVLIAHGIDVEVYGPPPGGQLGPAAGAFCVSRDFGETWEDTRRSPCSRTAR